MTQQALEEFIAGLPAVEQTEAYGYRFFFVGSERMLPFATMASNDSEYDNKSNLDREGVYRVNIGVSKESFDRLVGHISVADCDFAQLNAFLPHPDYAKQHFLCILAPTGDQLRRTQALLEEAHGIAVRRQARKGQAKPSGDKGEPE